MMPTLDEIALKYQTDKSSKIHNYTEKYAMYFEPLRNDKIKVLEIGIQNGHSLKTWEEYFPNAEIFGLDIADCKHMDTARTKTLQGSQDDPDFLKKINDQCGPFDIIIDDGSHVSSDMKMTFDFLFPLLKKHGIYVVEDLHCCYWPHFNMGTNDFMRRLKQLLDDVNARGKCGIADIARIEDDQVYKSKKFGPMTWWEKSIEYIHVYRGIVFIKKELDSDVDTSFVPRHRPSKYFKKLKMALHVLRNGNE